MKIFTNNRRRFGVGLWIAALLGVLPAMTPAAGPVAAQVNPSLTPEPITQPVTQPETEATTEPTVTATPPPPGDIRFGVIESFEDPAAAGRIGAAWTRARFQWAEVQPDSPRDWRPPLDDEELAAELDAGREVVGLLIGIPDWARDRRGLPRGLSLPPDDPDNTWAAFVTETVSRYEGRIDRWIIWNEPDIADRNAPGHTWDGTLEEFFQLQRVAYLAAKAANPDAVVHLGAFTYFWDPGYFSRFLDVVIADPEAAANNYYFDVATAHLYFQPNTVYNVLYAFRYLLDAHGLDQPIWLVETNAPPMDDPYWTVDNWTLAVSLNEQAAFIPQAIAAAFAGGAERVSVYKLKDTEGDRAANPEPFGLVRWDDSRRPAFDTYRVAIRLLGKVTAAERERWDEVAQVRLEQPGQTTTVLFARLPGGQEATVIATAKTAELVDMWGKRETIEAENGVFTVELPGALCRQTIADYCMIGGTTYYLIQESAGSGRPADSKPAIGDEGTFVAALMPSPTPSTTPSPAPSTTSRPSSTPSPSQATTIAATEAPPTATPNPPPATSGQEAAPGAGAFPVGLLILGAGIVLGMGLSGWLIVRRGGGGK
ncbi:MAG TPA: hypothetical protein PK205_05515 [Promineifilum sp.]|nr:hypothetical protein [Promineifilum sp.]